MKKKQDLLKDVFTEGDLLGQTTPATSWLAPC